MQGMKEFIPTASKINYINTLLEVGFDTVDFGSFVSPKAVPQMKDTAEVLNGLSLGNSKSKLLAIIANTRGIEQANQFPEISYLGFPLSISETFQQKNTGATIEDAFKIVEEVNERANGHNQKLVVYLSMGFGNPYGDPYSPEYVIDFLRRLREIGVEVVSLSDTVGVASEELIEAVFTAVLDEFDDLEIGAHLHSTPQEAKSKIDTVIRVGCRRIDGAIRGFGGCPMAIDELVGNIPTEVIVSCLEEHRMDIGINRDAFRSAMLASSQVFPV